MSSKRNTNLAPVAKYASLFFLFSISLGRAENEAPKKTKVQEGISKRVALDSGSATLKVSQINSCATLDRIPWATTSKGIRTRRIFKDSLKKIGDKNFERWELYQVLRKEGIVSFVFQKTNEAGKEEYMAARGDVIQKIIEVKKGRRRTVEKEDMKPLINRTAVNFVAQDGSRVEYIPGQTSKSTVVIIPTNDIGVSMAPVYLKGISCDKPESFSDDDIKSDDLGQKGKESNKK